HRSHHGTVQRAGRMPVPGDDVQQVVAVIHAPRRVHHLHAITVAVECNADVRPAVAHQGDQRLHVRGADITVDVQAVRRHAHGHHVRTQRAQQLRSDDVTGAVRAIEGDLHAGQGNIRRDGLPAIRDVTRMRVRDAPGAAELGRVARLEGFRQLFLDGGFDAVRQLVAVAGEELDAVV